MPLKPQYDTPELRARLSAAQYDIVAHASTEPSHTGAYWDTTTPGEYRCIVCDTLLFDSATKFDSGCGWPSFYDAIPDTIEESIDHKIGYPRTEIHCKKCGAHLGHVFQDGPRDKTGLRYCLNSGALNLA
jgi:peptide-methionine (R)-S-oxide reductase